MCLGQYPTLKGSWIKGNPPCLSPLLLLNCCGGSAKQQSALVSNLAFPLAKVKGDLLEAGVRSRFRLSHLWPQDELSERKPYRRVEWFASLKKTSSFSASKVPRICFSSRGGPGQRQTKTREATRRRARLAPSRRAFRIKSIRRHGCGRRDGAAHERRADESPHAASPDLAQAFCQPCFWAFAG